MILHSLNMPYYQVMNLDKSEKANIGQVKEQFSAYVTKAEKGADILICRRNRPVVQMTQAKQSPAVNRTRLGSAKGSVLVKGDLTEPGACAFLT